MSDFILEMKSICKSFGSVVALDNVNLKVKRGTIHALVGENGAGKSTLMNILSGVYPFGTYSGDIVYDNEICKLNSLKESEAKGIVIIHQELSLLPNLSVAENLFLGNEFTNFGKIDWNTTFLKAREALVFVGLDIDPSQKVGKFGTGVQQLIEIAKAFTKKAKLLILDEPTSSLTDNDAMKLLNLLKVFRKQGMTSIIISHKLNEISYVADELTVIRDGCTVETIDNSNHSIDEARIIKSMAGREILDVYPKRPEYKGGEVILEAKAWNVCHFQQKNRKVVCDAAFNLKKGEVLGFAGLQGAGRTELALSIFGRSYEGQTTGQLLLKGEQVDLNDARAAIDRGIIYLTEDRKANGLLLKAPIYFNLTLASLNKISKKGILSEILERQAIYKYRDEMSIKTSSMGNRIDTLSGGNQQKVLLSRCLFSDPEILILDEPTRGVDVEAKHDIYLLINKLIENGLSVILISSDMSEIIGMCDRVYVMSEGHVTGEVCGNEISQENLMKKMLQCVDNGDK